jgi:hypothetical protein
MATDANRAIRGTKQNAKHSNSIKTICMAIVLLSIAFSGHVLLQSGNGYRRESGDSRYKAERKTLE